MDSPQPKTGALRMLNNIPIIGWLLDFVFKASLSLPFWLIWSVSGIGKKFFPFLPEVYLNAGFWETVGVFIVVPIVYSIFVPKFVKVSNTQKVEAGKEKDK